MKAVCFWIVLSKVLVALAILYAGIGLMPDEAQYWTWSKELSYGYYSKPPGIAWQIAFGTYLFGDTEFGVRFASLLLSLLLSMSIYFLMKAATLSDKQAFWGALSFSFCPLGFFSGFFATTDCSYVLFWTLAALCFLKERALLGPVIALGALWKWPLYAIWLSIGVFSWRKMKWLVVGIAISLLGLLPPLIWNAARGFPTFQHVGASITTHANPNPLEFLGAQAALVSPLLFCLLIWAHLRFPQQKELRFCYVTAVAFFLVIFIASFFEKVQGNWAVAAYPTAFVIMACFVHFKWMKAGIAVSLLLLVFLFAYPLPYRLNPFKQGLGWGKIDKMLLERGYKPERDFLFSDRYQATSILSFYGPEKKRAYFFNLHGLRHNQYDYWPTMKQECLGRRGYFVEFVEGREAVRAAERFQTSLKEYFDKVQLLPFEVLVAESGEAKKVAVILQCSHYNGKEPSPSLKY